MQIMEWALFKRGRQPGRMPSICTLVRHILTPGRVQTLRPCHSSPSSFQHVWASLAQSPDLLSNHFKVVFPFSTLSCPPTHPPARPPACPPARTHRTAKPSYLEDVLLQECKPWRTTQGTGAMCSRHGPFPTPTSAPSSPAPRTARCGGARAYKLRGVQSGDVRV